MGMFYLKPTIKIEPFIGGWYAWAHLIPPTTAAGNIVERHLKIMNSYVQNPQIHAQAMQDPKLLGGPFIDLGGGGIEEIKELIEKTKKSFAQLIVLNQAIKDLDRLLQTEAQGDSLKEFYKRVPIPLKGLVELVYNLNNHPSIRFIEPLIYESYYSSEQQGIALSEAKGDFRKFVLSTPQIEQEDKVYIEVPFSNNELNELFKAREMPQDLERVRNFFQIPSSKKSLFESFFTKTPPSIPTDKNYRGDGIRLRYFGHACVLLETGSVSILLDPVISYSIQETSFPRYTLSDVPDYIDYVLITHNHQDHLMFETLLQLRHKIGHIVFPNNLTGELCDPSIKLILQNTGFSNLIELKEMESIKLKDGEIISLPFLGEHSDLNIQSKLSYCIRLKDKKFLFAADSSNMEPELYNHIFQVIGSIDMLFLGMECDGAPLTWLYGPLLTQPLKRTYDKNRALSGSNFEQAWGIVEKSGCKAAYIYAMGQEPWLSYVMALKYTEDSPQMIESNKLVEACKQKSIISERLFGRKEWHFS